MRSHEYTDAPADARPRFREKTNHKPRHVADWRAHCRPLDRNERARIVFLAEALERRTKEERRDQEKRRAEAQERKPTPRRNGQLGSVGLDVLRALVFGFLNCATGLLAPSYEAIGKRTGLCKQSVQNGLARLERTGIIRITARLCRQWIDRISPVTGLRERFRQVTQATNLYSCHRPGAWAEELELPADCGPRAARRGRKTPFPSPALMSAMVQGELRWDCGLSLNRPESTGRGETT